jgi:GNAT superfamily N-acetyltransferase
MQPDMSVVIAGEADAVAIAGLRTAVAADLTVRFGAGPWSNAATDRGVLWHMRHGDVLVARDGDAIIGTLALARRKPWAIDPAYFTRVKRPLLMAAAEAQARRDGFEAIRLDAYQGAAGAGPFYTKCGYADRGRAVYRETPLIYFEKLLPAASITCPAGRSSASRQPRR